MQLLPIRKDVGVLGCCANRHWLQGSSQHSRAKATLHALEGGTPHQHLPRPCRFGYTSNKAARILAWPVASAMT